MNDLPLKCQTPLKHERENARCRDFLIKRVLLGFSLLTQH